MKRNSLILAATLAMTLPASGAMAHVYGANSVNAIDAASRSLTGNWPVTVSHSQHSNGTSCLTLTQTSRDSGSASLLSGSQKFTGSFQVFNHTLVATIQVEGYGQNAGLVFIGQAGRATIGPGVFDDVYGGEAFDEGALAFGMKGGC